VPELRESQLETLRAIDAMHPGDRTFSRFSVRVGSVAERLARSEHSTERSLIRLADLGLLARRWKEERNRGLVRAYSLYEITDSGRAAISGEAERP